LGRGLGWVTLRGPCQPLLCWDSVILLPREAVSPPSMETLKARLDGALSTLIQVKMSLLTARGLG